MRIGTCVEHEGRLYYWDAEEEQIAELIIRPVGISDCPKYVAFRLMRQLGREVKAVKAGT